MAAQYTEVTLEDMDKFLRRAFRALRPKQSSQYNEYYYDLKLGQHVGIRVWTSVGIRSGTGAGVGADAIRVQLISLKDQRPLEKGKAPIVKRTQGWRTSLQQRIEEFIEKYEDSDEFWEDWASTRRVRDKDRDREVEERQQEREQVQEQRQEERQEERPPSSAPQPGPGMATEKQVGFAAKLLTGVRDSSWQMYGLDRVTGLNHVPDREELARLSKRTISQVIDILLQSKGGGYRRYAAEELAEVLEGYSYGR